MNTKPKSSEAFFDQKNLDDSSIERENAINEDKTNDTDILDLQGSSEAKEEHKESYFSSPKYNIANQKQSRDALLLKFIDASYFIKSNAIIIQRFRIQFTAFI